VASAASATNGLEPLSPGQATWRWRILLATYLGYGGYYLTRKTFTICKTTIAHDFGWNLGDTAHIWTAYLVAYMLGMFINSFVGRRWGPRVLLLGGLSLSLLCNVIFGFANSFATFLVFMFFNGLVQASGWPGSVGAVSHWLRPAERGTIMGFWSTNYLFGNMLVKSVGGFLLGSYGWRWSFWGCTLLSCGVWWLLFFWQRSRPEDVNLKPIVVEAPPETHAVQASQNDRVTLKQYAQLASNPIILAMGASYFCIKFLRYALDSWLPAFLNIQGLEVARASYYSQVFDFAGLGGVLLAGWALDRWFKGNWAAVCACMGLGVIAGYLAVIWFGGSPVAIAICFGLVGFMLYGPDTLLCGAASVQVAGEKNAVAVAGLVNGLGSIGSVLQEQVIGWLVRGNVREGIRNSNLLALSVSIVMTCLLAVIAWRLHVITSKHKAELPVQPST
jgi:OPA family glycerol-3-phosphate transporter-like MFS transporter